MSAKHHMEQYGSYAQLQCDFWGDALDEFGDFFIGLNILIRGLVSQVLYEFLRHGRSGISGMKKTQKALKKKEKGVPLVYRTDFLNGLRETI
jgi:hypothetical protein